MGRQVFNIKVVGSVHSYRVIAVGVFGETNVHIEYGDFNDPDQISVCATERYNVRVGLIDGNFACYFVAKWLQKKGFNIDYDYVQIA